MFLFEQQEEERWKEADTYTVSTRYWLRDATYHSLHTYRNWRSNKPKIEFQDMCGSKQTLGDPINYRTLNSSSKVCYGSGIFEDEFRVR